MCLLRKNTRLYAYTGIDIKHERDMSDKYDTYKCKKQLVIRTQLMRSEDKGRKRIESLESGAVVNSHRPTW